MKWLKIFAFHFTPFSMQYQVTWKYYLLLNPFGTLFLCCLICYQCFQSLFFIHHEIQFKKNFVHVSQTSPLLLRTPVSLPGSYSDHTWLNSSRCLIGQTHPHLWSLALKYHFRVFTILAGLLFVFPLWLILPLSACRIFPPQLLECQQHWSPWLFKFSDFKQHMHAIYSQTQHPICDHKLQIKWHI